MIVLLRGIPGAGKSTIAELLACSGPCFQADDFHIIDGEYKFDINRAGAAHKWCRDEVRKAALDPENKVVFVANTLTRIREVREYQEIADETGRKLASLIVENRHGNIDVHNVPSETLEAMKNRFDIQL